VAPSVDVVVPVRDRWQLTRSCLEHLRAQTLPHTPIVCDNGSTDGTPERLRKSFPDVRLVELGENLGFSVACNRGVEAGSGEVVVLLNNDVDCRPDFLERLVAPLADERVASVAALLLQPGEERIESFGLTADRTLAGFPRLRGLPVAAAAATAPALIGPSGAAGAYRRSAWAGVGGLDDGVLFYGEDVDLALRLLAAGHRTAGAADAVAVHAGSASAGRRSAWQRYQAGFSRAYFLRRYGLGAAAALAELAVVLADAAVFSHDLAAARGRLAGWRAAAGLPRNLRPPADALEPSLGLWSGLRLRLGVYTGREGGAPCTSA
jgi:N-acetylglucosaminyl-diphospho-decaprenol L-rhamnosyltransferase